MEDNDVKKVARYRELDKLFPLSKLNISDECLYADTKEDEVKGGLNCLMKMTFYFIC